MQMQGTAQVQMSFRSDDWVAFNQFLDAHPDIAKALQDNPDLVYDTNFMNQHTDLRDFCNSHPRVQQLAHTDRTRFRTWFGVREEVMLMDQFLDAHSSIDQQLQANPQLINDQAFLKNNPALAQFLSSHPKVTQAFDQHPEFLMRAADRLQNRQLRGDVEVFDQFLDTNPAIAKQLEANPSLINNASYLNSHPVLRAYLSDHPLIREEFTQNPSFFMKDEARFDASGDNPASIQTMDAYLDKHHNEARDLNAYPARVNDSDYLAHHKDLADFLKKHPDVRVEFTHNPSAFMHQESSFDACAQMDDFLGHHRDIAKDLNSNPDNVKDASYLNHHRDLKAFLSKNPGVSDQFANNPGDFMNRERRFDGDRQMDMYLSSHRNVAKDLQKNPDQVKDANYLDHHKDLKQVLDRNPELAQAANTDPAGFWQEQVKFQQDYKNQQVQDKSKVQQRATTHGPQ